MDRIETKERRQGGGRASGRLWWWAARGILFASGVSLFAYLGYRYQIGSVPDHGSLYGVIFPLSAFLALGALVMAVRPHVLERIAGPAGPAVKGGVVLLGAGWMATGLLCLRSLTAGVIAAPLWGTMDLIHMLSHHVVVPVGLGMLALGSRRVEAWFLGPASAPEDVDRTEGRAEILAETSGEGPHGL